MIVISKMNDIIRKICGGLLVLMLLLVIFQVASRRMFNTSVAQVEEIARYCMIWTALLGSAVGVYSKSHVAVDIIVDKLNNGNKRIVSSVIYVIMSIMFIILTYYGTALSIQAMTQRSPSMPFLQMGIIMSVVPITGILGLINLSALILLEIRK